MSWEEVQAAPALLHALANTMKSEDLLYFRLLHRRIHSLKKNKTKPKMCDFRLVLPFERHLKGEDDRPLPASKPRKPYKRNLDSKVQKAEKKRKRTQLDRELDSEVACLKCIRAREKDVC